MSAPYIGEIPKWLHDVTNGQPDMYLVFERKKFSDNLQSIFEVSRVNKEAHLIFCLSLALIEQTKNNERYEDAIEQLRSRIEDLESKINNFT
jgi:hypothetical protein